MSDDPGARATRRAFLRGAAALGLMEFGALSPRWVRANSLRVGQTAPPATLVTLDGQRISTADLIGHVVIPDLLGDLVRTLPAGAAPAVGLCGAAFQRRPVGAGIYLG